MPMTTVSPSWRTHSWSLVKRSVVIGNSSWAAVIAGRNKRHRRHPGRSRDIANDNRERGAGLGMRPRDITHRDRGAQRWAEPAARHLADQIIGGIDDGAVFARRSAPIGADTDATARRRIGELLEDVLGGGKPTLLAAALADGPCEPGCDRGRGLVDIV